MKAAFNGTCDVCGQLRPRCATVYRRVPDKATEHERKPRTWCEDCRKTFRGEYRIDEKHK